MSDKVEPTLNTIDLDAGTPGDNEDTSIKIYPERGRYQDKNPHLDKSPEVYGSDSWRESYTHSYSAFLSLVGRLDRFRSAIVFFAATFLSILFISATDKFVWLILNLFNSDAVTDNGFQLNPLVYIVIGVSVWLIALLLIAMGRLRDIGKSPWLALLLFLPPLSMLVIAYCVLPGNKSANRYGPPPKPYTLVTYLAGLLFLVVVPLVVYLNINSIIDYYFNIVSIHKSL